MSGFQRKRIEEDLYLWSATSIRVWVRLPGGRRDGQSFRLPEGYSPRMRGDKVILDGPAAEVLAKARRARRLLWDRRDRLAGGLPDLELAARTTTLAEVYELLRKRTTTRRRQATARSYRSWWPAIEPAFGHVSLLSIRPADIEAWLDQQSQRTIRIRRKGKSPLERPIASATVSHYRQTLIRLFNVAIQADLYPYANPAARTEPIAVYETEGRRLTDVEAVALLLAAQREDRGELWYVFFGTLLLTGLRFLEASRLRWEDFRWDLGLCVPNHQKASRRKDALVITPEWEAMLGQLGVRSTTGLLFSGRTGRPIEYRTAHRALKRIASVAGLSKPERLGLHAFRRTAVTAAEEAAGGDATALMRYARQKDIAVTRRYLPKVSESVRQLSLKTARKLGQAVGVVVPLRPRRTAAG